MRISDWSSDVRSSDLLLASHHSRSARMPVSIAGMQVGAQVSSSQDIRTCPSASQTIRGHDAQINTTSQPPHMRRPRWIVFIDLTDREAVFSPCFPPLLHLWPLPPQCP